MHVWGVSEVCMIPVTGVWYLSGVLHACLWCMMPIFSIHILSLVSDACQQCLMPVLTIKDTGTDQMHLQICIRCYGIGSDTSQMGVRHIRHTQASDITGVTSHWTEVDWTGLDWTYKDIGNKLINHRNTIKHMQRSNTMVHRISRSC